MTDRKEITMPGSTHPSAEGQNVIRTDLLARAYLDILAREEGVHSRPMLRAGSGDPDDPVEVLLDDLMDAPAEERVSVRPDLAAVAALTARAIEAQPGLTRKRLDRALSGARNLLEENRAALDAVAEALERSGYLSAAEIVELVAAENDGAGRRKARRSKASLGLASGQLVGGTDG